MPARYTSPGLKSMMRTNLGVSYAKSWSRSGMRNPRPHTRTYGIAGARGPPAPLAALVGGRGSSAFRKRGMKSACNSFHRRSYRWPRALLLLVAISSSPCCAQEPAFPGQMDLKRSVASARPHHKKRPSPPAPTATSPSVCPRRRPISSGASLRPRVTPRKTSLLPGICATLTRMPFRLCEEPRQGWVQRQCGEGRWRPLPVLRRPLRGCGRQDRLRRRGLQGRHRDQGASPPLLFQTLEGGRPPPEAETAPAAL
jgi:hypothetical protein